MPVIGYLSSGLSASRTTWPRSSRSEEAGFVEGDNLAIEYRWAEGRKRRLPRSPPIWLPSGGRGCRARGSAGLAAAMAATHTIPIVFRAAAIRSRAGFVESLNRPGGNVTGMITLSSRARSGKQLELLHELVPMATAFAVLVDPTFFRPKCS